MKREYIEDARRRRIEEVDVGDGGQGVTNVKKIVYRNMKDDRTELRFIVHL